MLEFCGAISPIFAILSFKNLKFQKTTSSNIILDVFYIPLILYHINVKRNERCADFKKGEFCGACFKKGQISETFFSIKKLIFKIFNNWEEILWPTFIEINNFLKLQTLYTVVGEKIKNGCILWGMYL